MELLLVEIADLFELGAGLPAGIGRVEDDEEHAALLADRPLTVLPLAETRQERQTVREAGRNLVVEEGVEV